MPTKKRKKVQRFVSIRDFCLMKYGKPITFREIPLQECISYYLTKRGDLLHWMPRYNKFNLITWKQPDKKIGKKKHKNGFQVDHYYQGGKRSIILSRGKAMAITFKGFSLTKAQTYKAYPKNGINDDVSLENVRMFVSHNEARKNVYGMPQKGKITSKQRAYIKGSKKSNKELAEKFKVHPGTITRNRNKVRENI